MSFGKQAFNNIDNKDSDTLSILGTWKLNWQVSLICTFFVLKYIIH